jgi:hypothetical protein
MPGIMSGNWINVRPGDPALSIGTNVCEWFELGNRAGSDYWLEAAIVGGNEFLFNGRIFLANGSAAGTVIDNFPKGPTPNGWTKRPRADGTGYELVSDGTVLFGYRVVGVPIPGRSTASSICFVTVNIYNSKGELVAESLPDEFRLHKHPATIGRGGIRFG